jgi:hypothetical protein
VGVFHPSFFFSLSSPWAPHTCTLVHMSPASPQMYTPTHWCIHIYQFAHVYTRIHSICRCTYTPLQHTCALAYHTATHLHTSAHVHTHLHMHTCTHSKFE